MKLIALVLLILLVWLQYKIWLQDGGIPEILQLEDEVAELEDEVATLQERNASLDAEVEDLKQGLDAIEERARNEMGMIGEDEIYVQVIDGDKNEQDQKATDQSVQQESARDESIDDSAVMNAAGDRPATSTSDRTTPASADPIPVLSPQDLAGDDDDTIEIKNNLIRR